MYDFIYFLDCTSNILAQGWNRDFVYTRSIMQMTAKPKIPSVEMPSNFIQLLVEDPFDVESDEAWPVGEDIDEFAGAPPPLASSKILASGEFGGRLRRPLKNIRRISSTPNAEE
jgi:hypothetical protein